MSTNVGSLGGLVALRDGLCHLAGSHLLHPATGEYTLPYLDEMMGDRDLAVVRLVHRDQGLLVRPETRAASPGSPTWPAADLSYVNRQRGAGTRMLLDHELRRLEIDPARSAGLRPRGADAPGRRRRRSRPGRADCGLGIMAAARAFGLDFVPVAREPYDLVVEAGSPRRPAARAAVGAPGRRPTFHASIEAPGGYSTEETGAGSSSDCSLYT